MQCTFPNTIETTDLNQIRCTPKQSLLSRKPVCIEKTGRIVRHLLKKKSGQTMPQKWSDISWTIEITRAAAFFCVLLSRVEEHHALIRVKIVVLVKKLEGPWKQKKKNVPRILREFLCLTFIFSTKFVGWLFFV